MNDPGKINKFFKWLHNHPVVLVIIALGGIVIYLGSFTDSVDKIITFKNKYITNEKTSVEKQNEVPHETGNIQKEENIKKNKNQDNTADESGLINKRKSDDISNDTINLSSSKEDRFTENMSEEVQNPEIINLSTNKKKIKFTVSPIHNSDNADIKQINSSQSFQIRQIVKVSAAALSNESMSSRRRATESLLDSLPNDLNASEISLLLGSETMSDREKLLTILVTKTQKNSLEPLKISSIVGSETMSNRYHCIGIVAPYIKGPISGEIVVEILGSETGSDRVNALRPIAAKIKKPLSEKDIESILRGVTGTNRATAIGLIL